MTHCTKRGNYFMYQADEKRYETMKYHRCGASGLMLPELSLGLWHNFGDTGVYENMKQMCFTAFDNGITHFDLANNYGPQPGSAEENFGKILRDRKSTRLSSAQKQAMICGRDLMETGEAVSI